MLNIHGRLRMLKTKSSTEVKSHNSPPPPVELAPGRNIQKDSYSLNIYFVKTKNV